MIIIIKDTHAGGLAEHLPSVIVYFISNSVLIHPHMTMLLLNTE